MDRETLTTSSPRTQEISTGDWVETLLIAAIPIVNLIMLFVWGFGNDTPASKANWAKATLIWFAIGIGIWFLFVLFFGSLFLLE